MSLCLVSVSKIEDQHARRVVVQQDSFRTAGAMDSGFLGEQIATSRPGVMVFIEAADLPSSVFQFFFVALFLLFFRP